MSHLEQEHIHETKTWGTRTVSPAVVVMVLRSRPERFTATDEQKVHTVAVLKRWADRYADRHKVSLHGIVIGPVGGTDERPATTFVVAFRIVAVPEDWLCFSGVVWELMDPDPSPMMVGIPQLFQMPGADDGEPSDPAATEVGGTKVTIGRQKRVEH